jgi:hypothetical protein
MDDGNIYGGGGYQDLDDIRSGVPNESSLPHLHAITFRRDQTLNSN